MTPVRSPGTPTSAVPSVGEAELLQTLLQRRQLRLEWAHKLEQSALSREEEAEAALVFAVDRAYFEAEQAQPPQSLLLPPTAGPLPVVDDQAQQRCWRAEVTEGEAQLRRRVGSELDARRQLSGLTISRVRCLRALSAFCRAEGRLGPILQQCERGLLVPNASRPMIAACAAEHDAASLLAPVLEILRELQRDGGEGVFARLDALASASSPPASGETQDDDVGAVFSGERAQLQRQVDEQRAIRENLRQQVQEKRQRELTARLQVELSQAYAELQRVEFAGADDTEAEKMRSQWQALQGQRAALQARASARNLEVTQSTTKGPLGIESPSLVLAPVARKLQELGV